GAVAKRIPGGRRGTRWAPAVTSATIGMSANARKMPAGSACRPPRGRAGDAASESAISTALRREQPGWPDIEHDSHQQIDQHRGDGRTHGAGRRWPHDQAQNVDRERSPERVDEADEERGQKGAGDRADAADDDDDERENENVIAHSGLDR